MRVYRNLFRLYYNGQKKNALNFLLIGGTCLILTYLATSTVLVSYWIACFLLMVSTLNTHALHFPLCLPVTRRQIVLSHYLYCLLLNLALTLLLWLVSLINPWKLGAGLAYTLPLLILFGLALLFSGVSLYFYYCGNKYIGLFVVTYYGVSLIIVHRFGPYLTSLSSPWPVVAVCGLALLIYSASCLLACRCFAQRDVF